MYSWSVNTSIIYYHQFLTTGSHFVLIYIFITQLPPLQVTKLFKPSFRTDLYGKNSITISALNAWNKIQTAFGGVILKNLTTTQIKTLLTKNCVGKYWQIFHLN